jgi:flavin-dependent dehydrogenase
VNRVVVVGAGPVGAVVALSLCQRGFGVTQVDFVQAQSVANKKALSERDPVKRREHLDGLRRTAEDRELHKKFLYRTSLIDSLASANAVE